MLPCLVLRPSLSKRFKPITCITTFFSESKLGDHRYHILITVGACALLILMVILTPTAQAQEIPEPDSLENVDAEVDSTQVDSLQLNQTGLDTLKQSPTPNLDSLARASQQNRPPGAGGGSGSPLEQAENVVQFQAKDSLVFDFSTTKEARLFGSAQVQHTAGTMTAGKITLNLDENTVAASTQTPSDTLSQPVLQRESDQIRSQSIRFNYKTQKGKFEMARVKVQGGNVIGTKVKKEEGQVVFIEDGIYSTCTLDHPHYYIKAKKMKIVDQDEVFFTNAKLFLLDIPYPLILPFGYVPTPPESKQSGLLQPTFAFQQQGDRGLGLQNLGWFQYFNDNLTGTFSFDFFTSGTFFTQTDFNYNKRDNYSGSVSFSFSRDQGLIQSDPNFSIRKNKRFSLQHSQTLSPYANLSANLNFRTSDFFQRNSLEIDERAELTSNSSLQYTYNHPENLFNFSANAQQSQNFQNNNVQLNGPNLRFSLKTLTPFKKDAADRVRQEPAWYESITLRYSNRLNTDYNFNPTRGDSAQIGWFEALLDPKKHRQATGDIRHIETGLSHDYTISSQVVSSNKVNVSASFNGDEFWYPTTIRKSFNPETNEVETREVQGFEAGRQFSTSLSASSTIYGISNLSIGNIQGFRHTFRPSLSYSFSPDFSSDFWGFFRTVQVDSLGNTQKFSIFEGGVVGGPGRGKTQSLNLNIDNVLETKVVKRDSTGVKKEEVIKLIDNLSANLSYNFAADRFKLSDLRTRLTSNVINRLRLNMNATFSFYDTDENGQRIDELLIKQSGFDLMRLTNFSFSTGTTIKGGDDAVRVTGEPNYPAQYDPYDQSLFNNIDPRFNQAPIQPLKSPWSASINVNYSYRKQGTGKSQTAIINARNIRFKLTPKWDVGTSFGYDFIRKDLTPARFNFNRQLHLWTLSFQMNPFGDNQFFLFRLSVNAGQLQSIFQKLPLLNNLERSSSPINRRGRSTSPF